MRKEGFTKIIRFESTTPTGEPTVQLVRPGMFSSSTKTASETQKYLETVTPQEGKTFVLVLAVSAGEAYGPNKNGDAFAESPIAGVVEEGETILDCYKTFETAGIYQHHCNSDQSKSMGRVVRAFYNHVMRRVELLIELDNQKSQDLVSKINKGEYPPVSMGCKIRQDICSRKGCHNKAATRDEYCDHIKFHMGEIDAVTGEKNFVWNPKPTWFDLSFVFRPADKLGFMMKKVAYNTDVELSSDLGASIEDMNDKIATIRKLSEMNKVLTGEIIAHKSSPNSNFFIDKVLPEAVNKSIELPKSAISDISKHPLPVVMSTLNAAGITPTCIEITRIMIKRVSPSIKLPECVGDRMAGLQGKVLDLFAAFPEILHALEQSKLVKLSSDLVNTELYTSIIPIMEKRSNLKEYLYRRTIGDPHPDIGQWQPYNIQTPEGSVYKTTRGAIERAQDINLTRQAKILGGSALLTGMAYKVLTRGRGKYLAPAAALGGLYGVKKIHDITKVPNFAGTNVPLNTEVYKEGADTFNDASYMAMLAQEYKRNTKTADSIPLMAAPHIEAANKAAAKHPAMAFLHKIKDQESAKNSMSQFIKQSSDSVTMNEVDLENLCYWVGDGLFS